MIFATGFVLFVIAWVMAKVDPETETQRIRRLLNEAGGTYHPRFFSYRVMMGASFFIGLLLMVVSVSIWAWRHLP